jgi:hypothetical protein
MCTKVPYVNRWLAHRMLEKLRARGYAVRSVHPCCAGHPGAWHVTRRMNHRW